VRADSPGIQAARFEVIEFRPRATKYCLCIPVINEGARLKEQLLKIRDRALDADVVVVDGGSTDGSTDPALLSELGIRTLLVETSGTGVSRQLQAAFAYGLNEGYQGIVTIDGNNKDDINAVPAFIEQLDRGVDLVQGSRFAPGGRAINTPISRLFGIKLVHAPLVSLAAGFRYHDTTNGFRAYSRSFLQHADVQPFRRVFSGYELLWYLSVRAPRTGHRVVEVPVIRRYPECSKIPTKISPVAGKLKVLLELLKVFRGKLDPAPAHTSHARKATSE
jgi:dolichol-phosphate mannosyltransferase